MKGNAPTRRDFLKSTAAVTLAATRGETAGGGCGGAAANPGNPAVSVSRTPGSMLSFIRPASEWVEGLPIANGISSAMVWGLPSRVVLSLNHVDFWRDNLGKEIGDYSKYLREAKRLMLEGKAKEANDLFYQKLDMVVMPRQKHPYPDAISGYTNSFQPLGNILIELRKQFGSPAQRRAEGLENRLPPGEEVSQGWIQEYRRWLDLENGIASITYNDGGKKMRQEYFVPAKDDALLVRITSDGPISARLSFDRPIQEPLPEEYRWSSTYEANSLLVEGSFVEGVKSAVLATARILSGEGAITADTASSSLRLSNVTDVLLTVTVDARKDGHNPTEVCRSKMAAVTARRYEDIRADHCQEHRRMFDRVELVLEEPQTTSADDTAALVSCSAAGEYPNQLVEQVFQMGRYLIMSSNRAGRRPANLQGIWNDRTAPAWDSDWHFDLNVEMNHWLVNPTNLEECNLALFNQMERFLDAGKMNARNVTGCDGILFYGVAGNDQTTWSPEGGLWTGAAAWMAQHFWTHYEYTLDRDFLAHRAYPFTKQVGLFYKDWLVKNQEGKYVSGFSFSPENAPPNGFVNNVHSFVDTATVREVMRHLLEGGKILDVDHDLWPLWQDLHDNVLPYQVTESGALKEWPAPLEEQPNHRHFSHLYPFFPGDEITRDSTPGLFTAAHKALQLREAGSPAWIYFSYAIAACMHARFGEGDEALRYLREMMRTGTLPNLISWLFLSQYRLMQTDGGLVATRAIAEMLLQSHEGFIRLLPALPSQWPNGHFKGLCARGAFTVDVRWKQGRINQTSILSLKGTPCKVLNSRPWKTAKVTSEGQTIAHTLAPKLNTIDFATEPGKTYVLEFA